jgi:mono/diheme cytochrome c family protein
MSRGLVRASRRALLNVAVLLFSGTLASIAGAADTPLTPRQQQGEKLFHSTCIYCHGERVWGTFTLERRLGKDHALLEKRTDLVGTYVKTVIRSGIGSMPAYRRTELSDADIEAIADYLTRASQGKPQ